MLATILHANDGSVHAHKALLFAVQLAKQNGSALHVVCVEEYPSLPKSTQEIREAVSAQSGRFHRVLEEAHDLGRQQGFEIHSHVLAGYPVPAIVELANELHADLLVIGATSHSAIYERIIESRTHEIVQLASCSVVIVK